MEGKKGRPLVARPPGGFPPREPAESPEVALVSAAVNMRSQLLGSGVSEDTADEMVLEWFRHQLSNQTGRSRF